MSSTTKATAAAAAAAAIVSIAGRKRTLLGYRVVAVTTTGTDTTGVEESAPKRRRRSSPLDFFAGVAAEAKAAVMPPLPPLAALAALPPMPPLPPLPPSTAVVHAAALRATLAAAPVANAALVLTSELPVVPAATAAAAAAAPVDRKTAPAAVDFFNSEARAGISPGPHSDVDDDDDDDDVLTAIRLRDYEELGCVLERFEMYTMPSWAWCAVAWQGDSNLRSNVIFFRKMPSTARIFEVLREVWGKAAHEVELFDSHSWLPLKYAPNAFSVLNVFPAKSRIECAARHLVIDAAVTPQCVGRVYH